MEALLLADLIAAEQAQLRDMLARCLRVLQRGSTRPAGRSSGDSPAQPGRSAAAR